MKIEILAEKSDSIQILNNLFQEENPEIGYERQFGNDLSLTLLDITSQKGLSPGDFKELIELSVSIGSNIAISILANYLYDKIKGMRIKIWLNNKAVIANDVNEYEKLISELMDNNNDSDNNRFPENRS